jgi:hypothetical protein
MVGLKTASLRRPITAAATTTPRQLGGSMRLM